MEKPKGLRFGFAGPVTRCECVDADESMPLVQCSERSADVVTERVHQFHWTGDVWAVCDPHPVGLAGRWSRGRQLGPVDAAAQARLLAWVNSVPLSEWRREVQREARLDVKYGVANLEDARSAVDYARECLRQFRCQQVVADLAGTPAGALALRVLTGGWVGSATELRATVRALTAPPT